MVYRVTVTKEDREREEKNKVGVVSFSLSDISNINDISEIVNEVKNDELLKETFIFDFFQNKKLNLLKVGFRFKFQASDRSLTDKEIDNLMNEIIKRSTSLGGINIEGI